MPDQKDFYKETVDNLPEGIIVCDSNNIIKNGNKNFEKNSGYTKEEIIGKDVFEIIQPSSKETCSVCHDVEETEEQKNANFQLGELKNKKGELVCVRISQSKTKSGNIIYLIIPFSDIAFLNQAHIDFVSTVSHELRTPLTSIKGFADTLLNAGDGLPKEQQTRFISIIKSQIDRLTRLVENLLTVSKLEAKRTKTIYKSVKIDKIIENVLYNLQHKSKEHEIEVNIIPNLPMVWADEDKLEQVMMNLIDNAVKYSKPGTSVNIEAKFANNEPEKIEIKVKDQGVGIPEEFLSRIFTKFSRIDSPLTRGVQGTGLGLYITKSLVKSMKGDIKVKSSENGSAFIVTLPAVSPETHTQERFRENN